MPPLLSTLPDPAGRLPELIAQALDLPPAGRIAFLEGACAGNTRLLAEARSLLNQNDGGDFLETPVFVLDRAEIDGREGGELTPGTFLDDCRVVRFLGQGGMGEVYLAEDTKLERLVAVKLLKRNLDDKILVRRFRHERRVLAALTHSNIARLYGGGTTDEGRSYLVMEYVEGERLDKFCDARGLNIRERAALFRKVCAAVAYAHQNLVVHRDLKPANIRVTPEGEPKLLDFGIAKLLDPEGTVHADPTLTLLGALTPEYASPEQVKGEPITTASDVYSLGVVLYELLCGQRPFAHLKSRRPDELARAVCEEEPIPPSMVAGQTTMSRVTIQPAELAPSTLRVRRATLRRQLEGDLDNIVAKALQKEPGRRYASVAAFAEDIRRQGEGLPVTARKDTLGYRASKFVRRHKAGVAAAALVGLALVAGLIVSIWQARVALRERDHATRAQLQAERLNSFLETLLGSTDPSQMGKDVKVSQVLDAAGAKLEMELAGEPAILAQAHETLYRSYRSLGLYEPAERHARAALAAVRRTHEPDDMAVARAESALATAVASRNHLYVEAEGLLRHALSVERAQPAPDHAALADTLSTLGYCLSNQPARVAEAEPLVAEALSHARAAWGEHSTSYLAVLNRLGNYQLGRWDFAGAETVFRQIIALQDQIQPGSPGNLTPEWNLCICLFNQDKLDEMEVVLNRLEADSRQLVGEGSVQFAIANGVRACLDFGRGEYGAAVPCLERALKTLSANFPPDQVTVVQCQALLGLCLTRDGYPAEGEPMLRAAFSNGAKTDHRHFDHTFGDLEAALGECMLAQKRYAEAEPLLLTSLDDLEKRLGAQNHLTIEATRRLHDLYIAWNKSEQAAQFTGNDSDHPASKP